MVNYQNGRIYKLVNDIDDKIYVGSTTTSLSQRKSAHVTLSRKKTNRAVYKHFNDIGWNRVSIILIEKYSCEDKEELLKRERYWIEKIGTLNRQIPTRTRKERRVINKEHIKDVTHEYYTKNLEKYRDRYNKYAQEYYKNNKVKITEKIRCVCGRYYQRKHKSDHFKTKIHLSLIKNI